ncbi:M13 family metallopeptidase [Limnovirga soli]|nr:M13 family metallopeptidase [Limnovirga soli]
MNKVTKAFAGILSLSVTLYACGTGSETASTQQKMYIDTTAMDPSVKPGDNFFLYVNGGWLKTAVIPPTESSAGAGLDLYNRTKVNLKAILDDVAASKTEPGSIEQKVGDFYASGMDSTTIEKLGYTPIQPALQKIEGITDAAGVMSYANNAQLEGTNILYPFYVAADEKNSSMNIAVFIQGGLGLPDRDYYFKTDAATQSVVKAYQKYIQDLFTLTGDDSATAAAKMMQVYNLEKQIAASHRTNVALRDPQANYNKMAVADLDKKMPIFGWKNTLSTLQINVDSINVGQPDFYMALNGLLKSVPVTAWKAYLRFHTINDAASALSSDFVNARFNYVGKAINGQQELKPRWERMVQRTDMNLGDAFGQLYVKKYFTEDAKKRMNELVNNLQIAFENRINQLDWMSDSTKTTAKEKLHAFLKKIGYTDKWRDYSKVNIDKNKFFDNLQSCARNEYAYQLSKVGKPVDKTEWGMTPSTINAYYNPTFNEIVFPAGILQFPFFDATADDAINYGAIGMVIGHEMTHGFDDQGAQYDKDGNLKNWWSAADNERFMAKTKLVVDLYSSFTVLDSMHINGALTQGENIADIGGINIAYDAFKMTAQGKDTVKIDGFTPDQRFFISLAQIWRDKEKDEAMISQINNDPHSPAEFRVNGPLMNFAPFYKAFNVKEGDKMFVPEDKRIKIW